MLGAMQSNRWPSITLVKSSSLVAILRANLHSIRTDVNEVFAITCHCSITLPCKIMLSEEDDMSFYKPFIASDKHEAHQLFVARESLNKPPQNSAAN